LVNRRYMLDTNTCIHLIKYRADPLYRRMSTIPVEDVTVSGIVAAELWYGVALSRKKRQNEAALKDFLGYVDVLDWPNEAGPVYGRIRAHLKRKGTPIGAMDLLIATHALFLDAVLVTDNTREFERVPDLKLENWLGR
jgi:tRNA(fMet)-specific endonuclease VapC